MEPDELELQEQDSNARLKELFGTGTSKQPNATFDDARESSGRITESIFNGDTKSFLTELQTLELPDSVKASLLKKFEATALARQQAKAMISKSENALRALKDLRTPEQIEVVEGLQNHWIYNKTFGIGKALSSTRGAVERNVDLVTGNLFMEGIQAMKGLGHLSDMEGSKIETSMSKLKSMVLGKDDNKPESPTSKAELEAELDYLIEKFEKAIKLYSDDKYTHPTDENRIISAEEYRQLALGTPSEADQFKGGSDNPYDYTSKGNLSREEATKLMKEWIANSPSGSTIVLPGYGTRIKP